MDCASHAESPIYPTSTGAAVFPDGHDGVCISVPREQWDKMHLDLRTMQDTIDKLRAGLADLPAIEKADRTRHNHRLEDGEREGIHAQSGQMGMVHLGSRSVLAYMIGLGRTRSSQDAAKTLLEENILPKLGLDNETATYPFVDLWSTDATTFDVNGLCKALPADEHCHE